MGGSGKGSSESLPRAWSGGGVGWSGSVSNAGSKPARRVADADGLVVRSTADRDLVSAEGLLLDVADMTDTARGRVGEIEGKVTPKFLLGSPGAGLLTGLFTGLSGAGFERGVCLILKRGDGENSASHQVSADSQRSWAFDLVCDGGFFLMSDLGRTGAAPETRLGVDMDVLSSGCDDGMLTCARPALAPERES